MLWQYTIKTSISALVPKFIEAIYNKLTNTTKKQPSKSRKTPDRTKFTEADKVFIKFQHEMWTKGNLTHLKTQKDLVKFLNKNLILNKGVTAYAKIWSPKKHISPMEV
jgi:hypothetical protein